MIRVRSIVKNRDGCPSAPAVAPGTRFAMQKRSRVPPAKHSTFCAYLALHATLLAVFQVTL
jgi:hypothetical protein